MSVVVVDSAKCNGDGICVAECPAHIIELGEDSVPATVCGAEDLCVDCGHCVAVCPTAALSHRTAAPEECPRVRRELRLGPEHVENFLRSRRSIRTYKDRAVDRELLARLIDVARHAPSSHNGQQVGWLVVYDRDEVRRLAAMTIDYMRHLVQIQHPAASALHASELVAAWDAGIDRIANGARHVIVAHALTKHPFAAAESAMSLSYVDLAARPLGLGTCYLGYLWNAATRWPPLQEALDLPEGRTCFGAMAIGYPEYEYHRIPSRKEARITWR